jgi:hypothetical protein
MDFSAKAGVQQVFDETRIPAFTITITVIYTES